MNDDYYDELSQFDDEWDKIETPERGDFDSVPDGTYQVQVEKVGLQKSKKDNLYLNWQLNILGPKFHGKKLFHKHMLQTSDNLKWLKGDLAICGISLSKISDLPKFLVQLLDLRLNVKKVTKGDFENVYFQNMIAKDQEFVQPDDDNIPF